MFSRPMSSMKLLSRMCDASGNLKSKLADYTPEILILFIYFKTLLAVFADLSTVSTRPHKNHFQQ